MMRSEPKTPSSLVSDRRGLPFYFVSGSLALDFVNTVNWTVRGLERERLASYPDLVRWAEEAGVVAARDADRLRTADRDVPDRTPGRLAGVHGLRDTLKRVFTALAHGNPVDPLALAHFNDAVTAAHAALRLASMAGRGGRGTLVWRWRGMGEDVACMLWPVARAAAELAVSADVQRLRLCAGEDCGWLFVDRSRNGKRRWCEMRTCGSVAKSRRYYQRVTERRSEA